jgi:hypothetical protein
MDPDRPPDDIGRRDLLGRLGLAAAAGLASAGIVAGPAAGPARADTALDVQILQTASSIARLAADTYATLLGDGTVPHQALAAITPDLARDTILTFLTTAMQQHTAHLRAFQAQTATLGGRVQDAPHPQFRQAVSQQLAGLTDAAPVLDAAAALEKVATDTYLVDLGMVVDHRSKELLGGAMAVTAQHLAGLRMFRALLASTQLLAVPFPTSAILSLPATVCTRAFPDALHAVNPAEGVAAPASGAVG